MSTNGPRPASFDREIIELSVGDIVGERWTCPALRERWMTVTTSERNESPSPAGTH